MSLKENVDYIKEEISTQESFIEKFFKVEQFYKKYKLVLIGSVVVIIFASISVSISSYYTEQNLIKDNKAFNVILTDKTNTTALEHLKENNQKLYNLALYVNNKEQSTEIEFLKELTIYAKAIQSNSIDELSSISQNQKFLLKDFAIFNKALLQALNGSYQDAKESLKLIPVDSSVTQLANILTHHLLTK